MPRILSAKVIFYLIFLTVMDGTIMPVLRIGPVYPSFLCLWVCYTAFQWGHGKTVYIAFWAGLARDFLGVGPVGMEATILVALALILDFLVQKMEREFPGMYLMLTFLFVFFAGVFRLILGYPDEIPAEILGNYLGLIALTALYTSVLLPVFSFLSDRWFGSSSIKQYELFH